MDRYTVADTVELYEINYERLISLFPRLQETEGACILLLNAASRLRLDVVENGPQVMVIDLSHDGDAVSGLITRPQMRVRVYHDAKVAEVLSYQQHFRFQSRYRYPNTKMFCRHEKRIVNLFLGEWLEHCSACWHKEHVSVTLTSAP